jgi:ATP-dependent exoDNAse (exonuclease V) beta subunit
VAAPDRTFAVGTGPDGGAPLRGYEWGSAVHAALAAAARAPGAEALRGTCRDLLVEHGRPLDDHGEPVELLELLDLVRAVQESDLWTRAMRAEQVLSEVPFALPGWEGEAAGLPADTTGPEPIDRRQLDLFSASGAVPVSDETPAEAGDDSKVRPPTLLEGVIDLAFREPDGWVVADYKADVGTDPEFGARQLAYRRQVDLYADAWERLTGESVKERVLFFTAQGRTERW